MFLRRSVKYASVIYLLGLVINKIILGKVRFLSMIIEKDKLEKLVRDNTFQSLFFSADYDNKLFAKDRVALLGYVLKDTSGAQMRKQPLQVIEKGEVFDTERKYSSYELNRENLERLLALYGAEAHYFIFKPVPYKPDKDYVAYQIIPADENGMPLQGPIRETAVAVTTMNIQPAGGEAVIVGNVTEEVALMTSSSTNAVAGVMNPSPPATVSFEAEML